MKIKKGDKVKVLYGKDAGKTASVVLVKPESRKIVVEGVNKFKKHVKGDGQKRKSEIVDIYKPVSVAKVMLVCPNCNKPARVGYKFEGKKKVRVCKKCGKGVDVKVEEKKEVAAKATKTTKKETKKKGTK